MAMVAVTALPGAGQFTLFSYFAPYFKQALGAERDARSACSSSGSASFGADRQHAAVALHRPRRRRPRGRCSRSLLMALSLLLWPLGDTASSRMALVLVPWGLGCFASNSAQQARLGRARPRSRRR